VQVAHVVDDVDFVEARPDGSIPGGWAAGQLATSADFAHASPFWLHVSGGLNYQVVHHLFPGVAHAHYPALAPIVMRAAEEAGIRYRVYPSFPSALAAHFRHLRAMGVALAVPSLATIG
jgi:acyl-lipid (8-3)-desaturase